MLMLDQYLACIVIDGVVRETYAEEYSPEGNSVTCWIASEEGKVRQIPFLICYFHY